MAVVVEVMDDESSLMATDAAEDGLGFRPTFFDFLFSLLLPLASKSFLLGRPRFRFGEEDTADSFCAAVADKEDTDDSKEPRLRATSEAPSLMGSNRAGAVRSRLPLLLPK